MDETPSPHSGSNDKAEEWKTLSLEDFLGDLIHELRAPIMIIKGYTILLSDEKSTEYYPEALDSISQAVERIERLCQGVIEYRNELEKKNR
jgi:signal transduction histidine kinase